MEENRKGGRKVGGNIQLSKNNKNKKIKASANKGNSHMKRQFREQKKAFTSYSSHRGL